MNTINSINQVQGQGPLPASQKVSTVKAGDMGPSFKDTLSGFMNDVNAMQMKADESIQKMAAGEITDVHQVMNSAEEAKVAFNMMMEIRNKVMDAYQEVMRLRL